MVSVYPLLLFGGGSIRIDLDMGNFVMSVDDGWIKIQASSHQVNVSVDTSLVEKMLSNDKHKIEMHRSSHNYTCIDNTLITNQNNINV